MSRGSEPSEARQQPGVFRIERIISGVFDRPQGSHRFAIHNPGHQEAFAKTKAGSVRFRQEAAYVAEQLHATAGDRHFARTFGARNRFASMICKCAGNRMPTKDLLPSGGLQNADAGRTGMAKLHSQLSTLLQHATRIAGDFLGQRGKCAVFSGEIGWPGRAAVQVGGDQTVAESFRDANPAAGLAQAGLPDAFSAFARVDAILIYFDTRSRTKWRCRQQSPPVPAFGQETL